MMGLGLKELLIAVAAAVIFIPPKQWITFLKKVIILFRKIQMELQRWELLIMQEDYKNNTPSSPETDTKNKTGNKRNE